MLVTPTPHITHTHPLSGLLLQHLNSFLSFLWLVTSTLHSILPLSVIHGSNNTVLLAI